MTQAVYLNSAHEAAVLEAEGGPAQGDTVISIDPGARYYAEQRGWDPRPIGSFVSDTENAEARRRSEESIAETIAALTREYSAHSTRRLDLGEYFRFDIHTILGQIHFTRFVIEAVARTGVERHRVFLNERLAGQVVWGIRPHPDTLVASLAPALFPTRVDVVRYSAATDHSRLPLKRRLRRLLSSKDVDRAYAMQWRGADRRSSFSKKHPRRLLLVLGGQYDWKSVLASADFHSSYTPLFRSATAYPRTRPAPAVTEMCQRLLDHSVLDANQRPVWDTSALANVIARTARYLEKNFPALEREAARIDGAVTSVFVTPMQVFWGDLISRMGKPVICYQHGEQSLYPEIYDGKLEATYATHYFAYGEGVAPKYRAMIAKQRLREVDVVGSTAKKPDSSGGDLIVYATGKWFKTARVFTHTADPDDRLYGAQKKILATLEVAVRDRSARVVVKANNTDLFNELPYRTSVPIDYASRFTAMLREARAVILDTPATTVIEAAFTAVPLFVLSGRTPWYPEPMALLRKRAIVEDNVDTLMMRFTDFLESGRYDADPQNREFAEAFGGTGSCEAAIDTVNHHLSRIIA